MNESYYIKCNKFRKFKNPKTSCILKKKLVLSITSDKCDSCCEKYLKKKNQMRY